MIGAKHRSREWSQGAESDQEGFRVLYERFNTRVYNFFANRGCLPEECRDLVQETFFRAFRSAEDFRGEAARSTWLFAITKHVWLEVLRKRSRLKRKAEEVSFEDMLSEGHLEGTQTERGRQLDTYLDEERARLLREALEDLPPQMRGCVRLRVEDHTYKEIADVMQTSVGTVKSQLFEARERLKSRLSKYFSEIQF